MTWRQRGDGVNHMSVVISGLVERSLCQRLIYGVGSPQQAMPHANPPLVAPEHGCEKKPPQFGHAYFPLSCAVITRCQNSGFVIIHFCGSWHWSGLITLTHKFVPGNRRYVPNTRGNGLNYSRTPPATKPGGTCKQCRGQEVYGPQRALYRH